MSADNEGVPPTNAYWVPKEQYDAILAERDEAVAYAASWREHSTEFHPWVKGSESAPTAVLAYVAEHDTLQQELDAARGALRLREWAEDYCGGLDADPEGTIYQDIMDFVDWIGIHHLALAAAAPQPEESEQ